MKERTDMTRKAFIASAAAFAAVPNILHASGSAKRVFKVALVGCGWRGAGTDDGVLDFRKLRDALEKIGYNGWVAVESDFRSDADHGLILKRFVAGEPVWTNGK